MPEVKLPRFDCLFSAQTDTWVLHRDDNGPLCQFEDVKKLASDYDALEKKLKGIEKRLPPCGPCDIGENTECICKEMLVPKKWMDEEIAMRQALEKRCAAAEKWAKALKKAANVRYSFANDGWREAADWKQVEAANAEAIAAEAAFLALGGTLGEKADA